MKKVEASKSGYRSKDDKKWDDINQKKSDGIAWNGAHTDASQIVSALINVGFIKIETQDQIKEEHQKWVYHFYDSRLMH